MSIEIFRDYKVLNNRSEIVTLSKFIHSFNRDMLFNRWVAPSVVMNSNVYVIDDSNYRHLYSICLQRDIIKNQNRMSQYKSIQQMLISLSGFCKYDFIWNKAFNIIDYNSGNLYECRILYAYFISTNKSLDGIRWRVFIDDISMNLILKTSLIKKLMSTSYTNCIIQLSLEFNPNLGDIPASNLSVTNKTTSYKEVKNKYSSK